jgi:hypothetical protein
MLRAFVKSCYLPHKSTQFIHLLIFETDLSILMDQDGRFKM